MGGGIEVDVDDDAIPMDTIEEGLEHSVEITQLLRCHCLSLQTQLSEEKQQISEMNNEKTTMRIEAASRRVNDVTYAKLEGRKHGSRKSANG